VARAVDFLASAQLEYGEFRAYACGARDLSAERIFESSPFPTSLVLHALEFVEGKRAEAMIDRGVDFLSAEIEGPGLFRFFGSRSLRSLPIDVDDTACASLVLRRHHPLIAERANEATILANQDASALFYTWVGVPQEFNDIDAVVNANVVCYLGESGHVREACAYLVDMIRSGRERESYRYYLDNLALYYAVSRAYASGVDSLADAAEALARKVEREQLNDGSFGDELQTAWAICALLGVGYSDRVVLEPAVQFLEHRQRDDGSWPARAAYLYPGRYYYGSEELTTAFALEALARSVT
jgi:hypothetical protein